MSSLLPYLDEMIGWNPHHLYVLGIPNPELIRTASLCSFPAAQEAQHQVCR
jgi:hypothetical protein